MNPQTTEERLAASRAVIAERLTARRQHPPPSPLSATVTANPADVVNEGTLLFTLLDGGGYGSYGPPRT